ncbi:hypothetical protein BKA64DRAFT_725566 [Cadophora sp. MPI-SDFR-AT-0126]|nr:hypothetical protein BKA64DRAFT_725566 [Leotiomycetes sp. MPI-SDFR-AT-0126]
MDRAFRTPAQALVASLTIHLRYCHWSTKSWVGYLEWLESRVEDATDLAVLEPRGFNGSNQVRREYTPKDLQKTQSLEDKINEAMLVMESNMEVLTQLRSYYEGLSNNDEFTVRQNCANDIRGFSAQVNDMIYDLKVQIRCAQLLPGKLKPSNAAKILQHLQGQATDKMESLTVSMHREAIAYVILLAENSNILLIKVQL